MIIGIMCKHYLYIIFTKDILQLAWYICRMLLFNDLLGTGVDNINVA